MKSVIIADDHAVIRQGLRRILEDGQEFKVCGEAGSTEELFKLMDRETPDTLVVDLSMPGNRGVQVVEQLTIRYPRIPVMVLSMHPADQYAARALKAGAMGYLSKECAPEQLISGLRQICGGDKFLSKDVLELLAFESLEARIVSPKKLSEREVQVLLGLSRGEQLVGIASELEVSVKTVSTYRKRILDKLNLATNADIVRYVMNQSIGTSS